MSSLRFSRYLDLVGVHTLRSSPPGDAAGVSRLEQVCGPGDADGADGRVVLQTLFLERKLLQFHQRDVVDVGGGDVAAGCSRV